MNNKENNTQAIVLNNGLISVGISPGEGLTEIRDLSSGINYISGDTGRRPPLFELAFSEINNGRVQPGEILLSSHLANEVTVEKDIHTVKIKYLHLDDQDIDIHCSIRLDEETRLSYWRIAVVNHSPYALKKIKYPIIFSPVPLGPDPSADRILLPRQDGYLLPSPLYREWKGNACFRRYNQRFLYPGDGRGIFDSLCAQLMAYYNDAGGLYIGVHDPDGNPKYLGPVQTNANKSTVLDFSPELCLPEQVGNSYFPSFDYILGCFKGDWQDAADIYKKWSVKQSWCEKTIKERNDIPDWVKKGAFFFNFRLRGQSKGVDYLKSVPEYCKKWQDVLGVPLVAMMCGWEKIGEWIGPDYFPPYGEDLFKEMCIKLKEAGIHPFPFGLSGLKLPIRKKINRDWPQSELVIDYNNRETFKNKYRCHAALDSNGSLISDSAVESWDGLHAYACVSTSQARDQIYNASLRLINEYEVRICQADQMLGGSVPECYNPGHDHPPGRGSWQVNMLRQIYADTRKDAKKKEAGFALSQEYPSELYLQYLDVCHGRVYEQPRGLIGVPLFAYLYHEYLPCYGGDWSSMLDDNTCGVYVQASNFVYGSLPAGCSQSMFKNMKNELPENCNPDIIDMAKNTSSLFIRFPQYLLLGKMCKTPALNIPEIRVEMMGLNTSGWGKSPLMVPSVLHCLWQSPDGNRAYTLANISSENRVIRFQESDASGGAVLWINKNNAKNLTPVNNNIQFTLEPLDAGILELKA